MHCRLAIGGFLICTAGVYALAQESTPSQPSSPPATTAQRKEAKKPVAKTSSDAVPDAPAPSADKPSLPSEPALTDDPSQITDRDQPAPAPPSSAAKKHSASEDNPFPEEYSKQASQDSKGTDAPNENPIPAHGSGAPDSAGGESSSQQGLDKLDLYGDKDKKSKGHKNADPDAGMAYDPKLAAQDDKIGEFYLKNGNAPGAYARFKEATQHDAGDANAVFGLAESARRMNLLPEAAQAYQTYLFAFPDGAKARLAKQALAEMKAQKNR